MRKTKLFNHLVLESFGFFLPLEACFLTKITKRFIKNKIKNHKL